MYEVRVKCEFEAAHRVAGYPGKCNRLHGHSWTVEALVTGTELDELGMLVDFKAVKAALNSILDSFDHQFLNELPEFKGVNPTAENMSRIIYEAMAEKEILKGNTRLKAIVVWESPRSCATYTPDK